MSPTHTNFCAKLSIASLINSEAFFVELSLLVSDFWAIKVKFELTNTVKSWINFR